jgi:predicted amidophosphoribosyltransferase
MESQEKITCAYCEIPIKEGVFCSKCKIPVRPKSRFHPETFLEQEHQDRIDNESYQFERDQERVSMWEQYYNDHKEIIQNHNQ